MHGISVTHLMLSNYHNVHRSVLCAKQKHATISTISAPPPARGTHKGVHGKHKDRETLSGNVKVLATFLPEDIEVPVQCSNGMLVQKHHYRCCHSPPPPPPKKDNSVGSADDAYPTGALTRHRHICMYLVNRSSPVMALESPVVTETVAVHGMIMTAPNQC